MTSRHFWHHIGRGVALIGLASAVALGGGTPARAQDATRVYEVTITNLAEGQLLSPPVVATHSREYTLFGVGDRASEGVWTVAEQGNPTKLAEQLRSTPAVDTVVVAEGPIHRADGMGMGPMSPADPMHPMGAMSSATLRVESHGADRLSLAMMVGCTNDGFTGISAVPLSMSMVPATYYAAAYDAGTETNTQRWSDMPDGCNALGPVPTPADGMNARVVTDEPIQMHAGIRPGEGDLTAAFAWGDPIVKITVVRVE